MIHISMTEDGKSSLKKYLRSSLCLTTGYSFAHVSCGSSNSAAFYYVRSRRRGLSCGGFPGGVNTIFYVISYIRSCLGLALITFSLVLWGTIVMNRYSRQRSIEAWRWANDTRRINSRGQIDLESAGIAARWAE